VNIPNPSEQVNIPYRSGGNVIVGFTRSRFGLVLHCLTGDVFSFGQGNKTGRHQGANNMVEKKQKQIKTPSDLGQQIRQRRKASGMTLQDAAAMANVGVRFLSELERGKATSQLGLTLKILELFGLNLYVEER
jgi:HTH-type transcriptional regulator / antitoxin HipB